LALGSPSIHWHVFGRGPMSPKIGRAPADGFGFREYTLRTAGRCAFFSRGLPDRLRQCGAPPTGAAVLAPSTVTMRLWAYRRTRISPRASSRLMIAAAPEWDFRPIAIANSAFVGHGLPAFAASLRRA
jgi:hypothetical protein